MALNLRSTILENLFEQGPSAKVRRLIAEAHAQSDALSASARSPDLQAALDRFDEYLATLGPAGTRDFWDLDGKILVWVASADACADCLAIAAASPYANLPTLPGINDTRCGRRCRCTVEAINHFASITIKRHG